MASKQSSETAWLGLDLGTQSARAMVVSGTGETLAGGSHKLTRATVWHAENRYAGATDIALDPWGYAQAERLGTWASKAGLTAIWCSPLGRARETAAPAARAAGLEPRIDERLREIDFGQIEGRTMAEAEQLFPVEIRRFKADPAANPMPCNTTLRWARSADHLPIKHYHEYTHPCRRRPFHPAFHLCRCDPCRGKDSC